MKSVSIKGRGLRAIGRPGARSSNCVFVDEREKATRLAAPARSPILETFTGRAYLSF